MTNQQSLEKSLTYLQEISKLTEDNVYKSYIFSKLIYLEIELKRQLELVKNGKEVL